MFGIEVDRNAPLERSTGDTQILKTRLEEVVDHLVLSGFRLNEFFMFVDISFQLFLILGKSEEVGLFLFHMDFSAAIRTLSVNELRICPEGLTGCTVPAFIFALVDITLIIEFLEDLLDLSLMILIRRTDEAVIGGIHQVPDPFDLTCLDIDILFRCDAGFLCLLFDLLTMFIGARLEVDIITCQSLVAGDGISHDDLIGVADMRLAAGIRDRRRDVVFSFIFHSIPPEKIKR